MSDSNVLVLAEAVVVVLLVVLVLVLVVVAAAAAVRIQSVPLTLEGCYDTESSWNSWRTFDCWAVNRKR